MTEIKSQKKSKTKNKPENYSLSLTLNRKVLLGFVGAAAVLAIGATVLVQVVPTKLEGAYAQCAKASLAFSNHSALDEDGKGWFLDGLGDESSGLWASDLSCAITNVGVPESVISRKNSTTALKGKQEATYDGITVRWSYHPSNGLDLSFEIE